MPDLAIRLFGEFNLQRDGLDIACLTTFKAQQLLAFLLLNRERALHRETVLCALWSNLPSDQGRKALRQTLWQLQSVMKSLPTQPANFLIHIEADRLSMRLEEVTTVDIIEFQLAYDRVRGISGRQMTPEVLRQVEGAVDAYRGDLLDGWYFDWLLYDRQTLQTILIIMLDKLMGFYEEQGNYELGIAHGQRILRYDRAHERAHCRLMRLYLQSGDRTTALRQFDRCVTALAEELDVKPSRTTLALYNKIRDGDDLRLERDQLLMTPAPDMPAVRSLDDVIDYLKHLQPIVGDIP
jgi:DNA-binding SARP family transcriptional activator